MESGKQGINKNTSYVGKEKNIRQESNVFKN